MKLSIELFKSKLYKDNTSPLMFRFSHNGKNKYVTSGINIKARFWNSDKKRITCRLEGFRELNKKLYDEFNRLQERLEWFVDNDIDIDYNYIISNKPLSSYTNQIPLEVKFDSSNFIHIMKARIESCERVKTKRNYKGLYNIIIKLYSNKIKTESINQYFANQFRQKVSNLDISSDRKNNIINFFISSYKFGAANRWILSPYTFEIKKFSYTPIVDRDITYQELTQIINCFKKNLYTSKGVETSIGLTLFCLIIAMQGLAPYDLSLLKVSDLKLIEIYKNEVNAEQYVNDRNYQQQFIKNQEKRLVLVINTHRSKTNVNVQICCDLISVLPIFYYYLRGKSKDDYFIDCYTKQKTYTEAQYHNRCGTYFYVKSRDLNHEMQMYSTAMNFGIKHITYYHARHAFVNFLDYLDIPHDIIRKLVGHKLNTLEKNYINKVTLWQQSEVNYQIFNSTKSIYEILKETIGQSEIDRRINEIKTILE